MRMLRLIDKLLICFVVSVADIGELLQQLIDIEDLLKKRQELLETKIEAELKTARENGVKNKRGKFAYYFLTKLSINHRLSINFSRASSVETKKTLRTTVDTYRWHANHSRVPARSARERADQHRGAKDHGPSS